MKRVWKRDDEVQNLHNIWYIWCGCWQKCRQTMAVLLCMHSGFPAKIMEQTIVTSFYGVTRFSHAQQREGTIKGECNQALRVWLLLLLSFGCFDTSVWVFTKPQRLYFGCLSAPQVGSISRMHSVVCFSIGMSPDLFGGLWVIATSFISWQPGRPLPLSLEPGIERSMDHNPFSSKLRGQDKLLALCESLPVYLVYLCHTTKCGPVTYRTMHIYPWQIDPPSIEHRCLWIPLNHTWQIYICIYRTMHIYPWQIDPPINWA